MEIRVSSNVASFDRWIDQAVRKQLPFAVASALTRTAQAAQGEVRENLPKHFTIRSPWLSGGIRIRPASKRDWPHSRAAVGTVDEELVLQETGGTKRPRTGKDLAIPTRLARAGGSKRGKISRGNRPRPLIAAKKAAVEKDVIRRTRQKRGAPGLLLLYLLRPSANIKPRFHFREDVERKAGQVYGPYFLEALERAMQPRT